MSTLDDAYKAADEAVLAYLQSSEAAKLWGVRLESQRSPVNRVAIRGFLAHLVDDPPVEMVEVIQAPFQLTNGTAKQLLSDALRSIGADK